jgi:hypothetical protein
MIELSLALLISGIAMILIGGGFTAWVYNPQTDQAYKEASVLKLGCESRLRALGELILPEETRKACDAANQMVTSVQVGHYAGPGLLVLGAAAAIIGLLLWLQDRQETIGDQGAYPLTKRIESPTSDSESGLYCRYCGKERPSTYHLSCPSCGKSIVPTTDSQVKCNYCNMSVGSDSKYCGFCGRRIKEEQTSSTNTVSEQGVGLKDLTPLDKLERWADLKERNLVTEEEYSKIKNELLKEIPEKQKVENEIQSRAERQTGNFLIYEEASFGIRIQYPRSWQREDGDISFSGGSEAVRFYSPASDQSDKFQEQLAILVDNSPGLNANLDDYMQYRISSYKLNYNEFKLLGTNTDKMISGERAYMIWYSYKDQNISEIDIKVMEIGIIVNRKVYIISYYADVEKYFEYLPSVEKMLDSFEVTR